MTRALRLCAPILLALTLVACVVPPGPRTTGDERRNGYPSAGVVRVSPHVEGDLYLPRAGGNRGTIVLVHGGGFFTGSRNDVAHYTEAVFAQLDRGFAVLNIDYRLTTETTNHFPAALADVSAAVDWVRTEGRNYGANGAKVIVAGHSAGGTLAALMGTGANNPGSVRGTTSPVDGWIAISGIYDLREGGVPELERRVWLGRNAPPDAVDAASALTLVDRGDAPGYLIHGSDDPLAPLSQTLRMFLSAGVAGGPRPWLDLVTEPSCNGHIPTCAINTPFLDLWVDQVVAGRA